MSDVKKIALLLPANLWFCPFVSIYSDVLKECKIDYDIICWDKSNTDEENVINYRGDFGKNKISKLLGYWRYTRFIKKVLIKKKYNKIIIFSSQIGIFLSDFLAKHFKNKYIFDFRDLSIEQNKLLLHKFSILLRNSYANVISSPGFREYLPKQFNYILSHNFIFSEVQKGLYKEECSWPTNKIDVLTIGGIRDVDSNVPIIDALGNLPDFSVRFVGKGPASAFLQDNAESHKYTNIYFSGYYDKKDELQIVMGATFLNIFYPNKPNHISALSNRFYNSLIYRIPMITTKSQIQGKYCEKYNLGISISNTENLASNLQQWRNNTNSKM